MGFPSQSGGLPRTPWDESQGPTHRSDKWRAPAVRGCIAAHPAPSPPILPRSISDGSTLVSRAGSEKRGALIEQGVLRRRERVQDLRVDGEGLTAEECKAWRDDPLRVGVGGYRPCPEAVRQRRPKVDLERLVNVRR